MNRWYITAVEQNEDGTYGLALECDAIGGYALADVSVSDRNGREPHAGWDPKVGVIRCDDSDAQAWLEAAEHEYAIAEACVDWLRGLRRSA